MSPNIYQRIKVAAVFLGVLLFAANVFAAHKATNKTVLITGGLSGIGKEIATTFKNDGWNVWVTTRDPSKHTALAGVNIRKVDITDQKAVKTLVNEIRKTDGRLDVVVNNAGYGVFGPQEAISVDQARDLLNVNVIGPLVVIQESLPLMRKSSDGHIINVSSTSGLRAVPGLGMYAASKMALEGMSEALAAEVTPWNIKVSIIEPGTVNNDWVKNSPLAANLEHYPSYKTFTTKLRKTLTDKSHSNGQNPQEIAQLTLTVAKTKNPNLRYQTNAQASSVANEVLTDPTGNTMRDKMASMALELYEVPGAS